MALGFSTVKVKLPSISVTVPLELRSIPLFSIIFTPTNVSCVFLSTTLPLIV